MDEQHEVEATLTDDLGTRRVKIRKATPEEAAAFNAVAAGPTIPWDEALPPIQARRGGINFAELPPDLPPEPERGVWRAGDQPRGLVAPAIAYSVLGVAVGLALAGEAWDAWARRRRRRLLLRALVDAGVIE